MKRWFSSLVRLYVVLSLLLPTALIPTSNALRAESTETAEVTVPSDTPTPVVVNQNVEQWAVGNGLIYWAHNCFADEFNPFAELKRKPTVGGTERVLETINNPNAAECLTYFNLLSSSNGLYYFDLHQSRIERMPLGQPFTPVVVKELTEQQQPTGRAFKEADGYLYWVRSFFPDFKLYRVRKNGQGAVETVAETSQNPTDILILGKTVYWIDSAGLKAISVDCETLPCGGNPTPLLSFASGTTGYGLVHQQLNNGAIFNPRLRVYFVQSDASGFRIRFCTFNSIFGNDCPPVVIGPGSASSADEPAAPDVSDFYVAGTGRRINAPILADGALFWTESAINVVNDTTGEVKRRSTSATTPDTQADTIATSQTNIDSRLFASNDLIFFARRGNGIDSLSLGASAITRELAATGLEVTQAIQNMNNSVPVVANKTTYVRAYGMLNDGPNVPNVEAVLVGTRAGSPLPGSPLRPINGIRALVKGATIDRAKLNDGWFFQLPASWLEVGTINLSFQVDPRRFHTDPNRENNTLTRTITFRFQPPVCVVAVPVSTHTPRPKITDPNFWQMIGGFNRLWPIPETWMYLDSDPVEELETCWAGIFPYPCWRPLELDQGWEIDNIADKDWVIMVLWKRATTTFNPDSCDDIGAPVHFMGMVHPDAPTGGVAGYASTVSNQSWVKLPDHYPNPIPNVWHKPDESATMAQELAHNYGRKHVNCGSPDNIDTAYPYPPCQFGNVGPDQVYGFDINNWTPIQPNAGSDFMSYASRTWVSDYTWNSLLGKFSATTAAASAPTAGEMVLAIGMVEKKSNQGALTSLLILPGESLPPAAFQSAVQDASAHFGQFLNATYKLRFSDANGTVLLERTLTLLDLDDHDPNSDVALFKDTFAPPAGQVAKIELLADSTVLDTLTPGAALPTVAIQRPAGSALIDANLIINWTASDADVNDRLLYTVQYSHNNGQKWQTLVTEYEDPPGDANSLVLDDLGIIQSSAPNQALIRVLASDGYHTTIATSQPFTVKNRKPTAFIVTPALGQTFAAGQAVTLEGGATDVEDGGLSGSLRWNVDGATVGTDALIHVDGLAPGLHAAALGATDAASQTVTATVTFSVAPLSIPQANSPTVDGDCTDSSYSTGALLPLAAYGNGDQANVRLVRDNDALYACFSGLRKGASSPGAFVGLRVDVNNSREALAQTDDFGFFINRETGDVSVQKGDGLGNFTAAGSEGLQGQMSTHTDPWSAELRIDKSLLGGWDHLASIALGHYWLDFQGDDYHWPHRSLWNAPNTWATTVLGAQPTISALDPFTATVGSQAFTMTVEGSSFISGTKVLLGGVEVPTTFIDGEHLVADIGATNVSTAGSISVKAQLGNISSNELPFTVIGALPTIISLSPISTTESLNPLQLTINGTNFSADAQVLWNGEPLPTTVVNSGQLRVQLGSGQIDTGQLAGIAVRNGTPIQQFSNVKEFEVAPAELKATVYLPLVNR